MKLRRSLLGSLLALSLAGCGGRTGLVESPAVADAAATCVAPGPVCVRDVEDPCGSAVPVAALCEGIAWRCPDGAREHERVAEVAECVPTTPDGGTVRGSLARVPTDDGRCLWVAGESIARDGTSTRNVAFEADTGGAFGRCPATLRPAVNVAVEAVRVEGGDPREIVQVTGGYWLGGPWVTYRRFRADGGPHFGLTLVGSGVARWTAGGVVLPRAPDPRFASMDLGDAALALGGRAYVYGCPGPPDFLTERCVLARFAPGGAGEVFVGGGSPWAPLSAAARAATVFDAGPWVSSVFATPRGELHHVSVVGFGSELRDRRASAPEGPWSAVTSLGRCALPSDDASAYCAGPVAHVELSDPTRPDEVWVSYGVGTTASDGADRTRARPLDYATRFARVTLPR